MAYRASTYRPGIEDEPNIVTSRSFRERSPRRNGRRTSGHDASPAQGPRRFERRENRSRSRERSSPISSSLRRDAEVERRSQEHEDIEQETQTKERLEWRKDVSETSDEQLQSDLQPKGANDAEWDRLKAATHTRLGPHADEIIRSSWQGGLKVTNQNYLRFAAEVLIYVRSKFYTEIAKNEAHARSLGYEPGRDPRNGPYPQKLTLENMRWVCDTKIQPITDKYSRELFLCNGCENKNRTYTFDSFLQHYASKHTNALSKGTTVVNWRAEWPEKPPFKLELDVATSTTRIVAPSIKPVSNGPLVLPRGLNEISENREIEKKRREQQFREQEIRIEEAKEEIERKKCQARAIAAAITEGNQLQKQASIFEKPPSDDEMRDSDASNIQQADLSALQGDIHDKPQTDREAATESSERNLLPQFHSLNPEARAQSPFTRSIKTGNMDSNYSDTRANQRLHLTGLFTRFMSEVSQQTALQLRKDSAQKILEQKTAAYEKARKIRKEFPSAEESTRASKERARMEFDKVEKELLQRCEASMKLSEEISEIVYPAEEPSESDRNVADKVYELQNKIAQQHVDSELLRNKQQQLDQLYSTLMTANDRQKILDSVGNQFKSVYQQISTQAAKSSFLEAEVAQLKQKQDPADLKSSVEGLTSRMTSLEHQNFTEDRKEMKDKIEALSCKLDELQQMRNTESKNEPPGFASDANDLRNTMDSLSTKIEGLEKIKSELSTAVETINNNLVLHSAAINDRSEMQRVHFSINALSRNEKEFRISFGKLQSQMQALERDLRTTKMVEKGRQSSDAGSRDSNSLSNDLQLAIHDEVRLQQEAIDKVLDEKFSYVEGQLESLKEQFRPLERKIGEVQDSLSSFSGQYASRIDRIATDVDSLRGDVNTIKEEVKSLKHNDIPSLQMGCRDLDFRMNNLSTEFLARQILGQLEAHIRGSEKNVATLELRLQELERRAISGVASAVLRREVEEKLLKAKEELIHGVDERLEKFKSFIELNQSLLKDPMKLRSDIDTNRSKLENVKAEVEAFKSTVNEVMSSIRAEIGTLNSKTQTALADLRASKAVLTEATKALEAEVDSIGILLQTVQHDLATTKTTCTETTSALKAEISKAAKSFAPEKRSRESTSPVKANGHKRRKARQPLSDSDEDA